MSKPRKQTTLADMSLPAEERARGRKPGRIATPRGLMAHGTNPRARRHQRDGERLLAAEERTRQAYEDVGQALAAVLDNEAGLADVMRRARE